MKDNNKEIKKKKNKKGSRSGGRHLGANGGSAPRDVPTPPHRPGEGRYPYDRIV